MFAFRSTATFNSNHWFFIFVFCIAIQDLANDKSKNKPFVCQPEHTSVPAKQNPQSSKSLGSESRTGFHFIFSPPQNVPLLRVRLLWNISLSHSSNFPHRSHSIIPASRSLFIFEAESQFRGIRRVYLNDIRKAFRTKFPSDFCGIIPRRLPFNLG